MIAQKFFIDWVNRVAYRDATGRGSEGLPAINQGDALPLQITLIERNSTGGWSKVDNSNLALTATLITTQGGTLLVSYAGFTKDTAEKTFTGTMTVASTPLTNWLTSAKQDGLFALQVTDSEAGGGTVTIYEQDISVHKSVVAGSVPAVDPALTPLSLELARQMFVPYLLPPGAAITIPNQAETFATVLQTDADGNFAPEKTAL